MNQTPNITDAEIIAAIRDGARTNAVADRLGVLSERRAVYRRLMLLENAGKVRREARYSSINSIYWVRP